MSDNEFLEDNLQQFQYSTNKQPLNKHLTTPTTTTPTPKQQGTNQTLKKKVKTQKPNEVTSIQEMNFKYLWNYLKQKQDSTEVTVPDILKAMQVMKKPIPEEVILEMLNMNNEQLYSEQLDVDTLVKGISEEELFEIFKDCKLKF